MPSGEHIVAKWALCGDPVWSWKGDPVWSPRVRSPSSPSVGHAPLSTFSEESFANCYATFASIWKDFNLEAILLALTEKCSKVLDCVAPIKWSNQKSAVKIRFSTELLEIKKRTRALEPRWHKTLKTLLPKTKQPIASKQEGIKRLLPAVKGQILPKDC